MNIRSTLDNRRERVIIIYLKLIKLSLLKVVSGITKRYLISLAFVSVQCHKHISICTSSSYVTCP